MDVVTWLLVLGQNVGVRGYIADQWQVLIEINFPGRQHRVTTFCFMERSFPPCMVAQTDVCLDGATSAAGGCMSSVISTATMISVIMHVISCVSKRQAIPISVVPCTANSFAYLWNITFWCREEAFSSPGRGREATRKWTRTSEKPNRLANNRDYSESPWPPTTN